MPEEKRGPARPLDAVDRDAAGAGLVHLGRAEAHLDRLRHQLDLAQSCSDLCAVPEAAALLAPLERALAAATVVARDALRRATGIRARRSLPSPVYDSLFTLVAENGRTLCVMVPGAAGYDPDYWEEVPPDRGADETASSAR